MSDGIESVGAMATAGLAAAAIEGKGGHHGHGAHGHCANCGALLKGDFCHACGQAGHLHRSMFHIVEEILHGVFHFDGKAWRTLPLLVFRPGKLTYDYVHGHRVRYVTPLAMFLFTVFVMFMVFSMLGGASGLPMTEPTSEQVQARQLLEEAVTDAAKDLAEAEQELATAIKDGDPTPAEEQVKADAQVRLDKARTALTLFDSAIRSAPAEGQGSTVKLQGNLDGKDVTLESPLNPPPGVETTTLPEYMSKHLSDNMTIDIGSKSFQEKIKKKLKNPELLIYKLQNTAYKFSWLLIPISLPFLWLLFFWKRGVAMYDHAIFALYSLSFMSLLFIVVSLLFKFTNDSTGWILSLLVFAPPVHMFAQLKGAYRLSTFSALWRTAALLIITSLTSTMFILFIVSIGVVG